MKENGGKKSRGTIPLTPTCSGHVEQLMHVQCTLYSNVVATERPLLRFQLS